MPPNSSFQARLSTAVRGGAAAAHKCRLLAARHGGIHVFVEGENDRPFYEPFMMSVFATSNIWFHVADGRPEVLHARSIMPASFSLATKVLYAIDRDFDAVLPNPPSIPAGVFVTCFYSVESYFSGDDGLRALFATHGNIDWSSQFARETQQSFANFMDQVRRHLAFSMAIAIVARSKGNTANLNNVKFNALIGVDENGNLSPKEHFKTKFAKQANIDLALVNRTEIRAVLRTLKRVDARLWIRGKYLLALFVEFVRARYRLVFARKKAKSPDFRHARTRVNITGDDLMGICSGHLPCPPALGHYLQAG